MLAPSRAGYVIHEGGRTIRVTFESTAPDDRTSTPDEGTSTPAPPDAAIAVFDGREGGSTRTLTVDDRRVAVVESSDHTGIEIRGREWAAGEPLDDLVQRVVRAVRYDLQIADLFAAALAGPDGGPAASTACLAARCDDLVADFDPDALGLAVEGVVGSRRADS